jgi:hypothetical protein
MSRTNKQLDEINSKLDKIHDQVRGPTIAETIADYHHNTLEPKAVAGLRSVYAEGRPFRVRLPNWVNHIIDFTGMVLVLIGLAFIFIDMWYAILIFIAAGLLLGSSPNSNIK